MTANKLRISRVTAVAKDFARLKLRYRTVLAFLPFMFLIAPLMGQQTGCTPSYILTAESYYCSPGICPTTIMVPKTISGGPYKYQVQYVPCTGACVGKYAPSFGIVGACSAVADAWPGLRQLANRKDLLLATCDGSLLPIEDQKELFANTKPWSIQPKKVAMP